MQIKDAVTIDELKSVLMDIADMLVDCGFVKPLPSITLQDQPSIIKAVLLHYLIFRSKAELRGGGGLQTSMHSDPDLFESLFTSINVVKLTPGEYTYCLKHTRIIIILCCIIAVVKSFFLGRVLYSPTGSNSKQKEMATYIQFCRYLEECEGW